MAAHCGAESSIICLFNRTNTNLKLVAKKSDHINCDYKCEKGSVLKHDDKVGLWYSPMGHEQLDGR